MRKLFSLFFALIAPASPALATIPPGTVNSTTGPVVSVVTPGTLTTGTITTVKWTDTYTSPIVSRKVEFYSGTLGKSWSTIGNPWTDSLPWTVVSINSLANSDSCRFRVTIVDASNDTTVASSSPFRVQPCDCGPVISNLIIPVVVNIGTPLKITWTETPDAAPITKRVIMLSTNSGTTWDTIGHPTTNSFMWTVPNQQVTGVYIRVAITDANGRSAVATASVITIADMTPPTCTVVYPCKTSVWEIYGVVVIAWNASDNVGVTRRVISYNKIGSSSWNLISDDNSNTSAYVWAVPNDTGKAKIQIAVYDAAGNTFSAFSDTFFITNFAVSDLGHSAANANLFGIKSFGKTVRFGVNAGEYSIMAYDMSGRLLLSRKSIASQPMYLSIPFKTGNASIVRLEQAGKVLTKVVMPQ